MQPLTVCQGLHPKEADHHETEHCQADQCEFLSGHFFLSIYSEIINEQFYKSKIIPIFQKNLKSVNTLKSFNKIFYWLFWRLLSSQKCEFPIDQWTFFVNLKI
jgi:hypothetical protein